jgi:Rap1a immunity proteins
LEVQKSAPPLVLATLLSAVIVTLSSVASAGVSLEKMMRNCLLLEEFWDQNTPTEDTVIYPNNGAAVCFGYLMAFRGLEEGVEGGDCSRSKDKAFVSGPSCHPRPLFCVPAHTSNRQILGVFLDYAGNHVTDWREGAAVHYLRAMQGAFPCKGEGK